MANLGSTCRAAANAWSASSYQNECSAATPRRNWACAPAAPEVGNSTTPSRCATGLSGRSVSREREHAVSSASGPASSTAKIHAGDRTIIG
jgi:hypothetical protein